MSIERSMKQYMDDRRESVRIAARLLLASGTTSPRVGGVGECSIHIIEDECAIEELCQFIERMSADNGRWDFFKRDAAMLRDADAVLVITSMRCKTDPADTNCNMCGKLTCEYLKASEKLPDEPGIAYPGPLCVFRANNISYAVDERAVRAPRGSTMGSSGPPAGGDAHANGPMNSGSRLPWASRSPRRAVPV